jgi:hypothetical protein
LTSNPAFDPNTCVPHVLDISSPEIVDAIGPEAANVVVMIFSLSALSRQGMTKALVNAASILCTGGTLLIRDYGVCFFFYLFKKKQLWLC